MLGVRYLTRGSKEGEVLFKEPKKNSPPPFWIRAVLVATCTLVSFFHGSNDGQKGVGLVMLILIAIVPTYFALNSEVDLTKLRDPLYKLEASLNRIDSASLSDKDGATLFNAKTIQSRLAGHFNVSGSSNEIPSSERFSARKDIVVLDKSVKALLKGDDVSISDNDRKVLESSMKSLRTTTDYSPTWVLVIISLSLGVGTVIGWKRIVRTIGEKIGKEHLNYAQGASAEFVASTTIGLSSFWGWPVSTTQILSSAVAGSMVASRGVKNLQLNTVRNILVTWVLTLPVVVMLSGSLFLLFRNIFG
jgi:PiT family inorganic phosphate transporter